MALDNYPNLLQSIKVWSHREDIDVVAEDCVTMAEQELFYGQVPFRIPEMMTEEIVANSAKTIPYPDDMLELISFSVEEFNCYHELKAVPKNKLPDNSEISRVPHLYSMFSQFELDTVPDKSYNFKIEYFKKLNALSDDDPTNTILTKYPTAYLWASQSAAFMYAGEEDKANLYAARARDVIDKANADANNLLFGAVPDQIIDGYIP